MSAWHHHRVTIDLTAAAMLLVDGYDEFDRCRRYYYFVAMLATARATTTPFEIDAEARCRQAEKCACRPSRSPSCRVTPSLHARARARFDYKKASPGESATFRFNAPP